MRSTSATVPLWTPSPDRIAATRLTAFTRHLESRAGRSLGTYDELHALSVQAPDVFWPALWDFVGVIGDRGGRVLDRPREMPGARFFPDARVNFTENLLRRRDDAPAIIATSERGDERTLTWADLSREVIRATRALRDAGVRPGDRVCGIVANVPEAIIAALGAAALGATWSSCSPDFGVQGILDRFGQISPIVLFAVNGYDYGGKRHDVIGKLREVVPQLSTLMRVVIIPFGDDRADVNAVPRAAMWEDWLGAPASTHMAFERFAFNQPLYILYSSGTTGIPKCIVHGAGGTLVQHVKEHQLHCDIRADDRVFYFTTCGWMMWNWLVTVLASEATMVLYDGSPFHPSPARLFDLVDRHRITLLGVSAKFVDAVNKSGGTPQKTHSLASVRTITSTGSPLSPESFEFVYRSMKADVHLASISGGTDIVSCFVGGNPNAPVWRGEIQVPGLGMDVDVFDDAGRSLRGESGELVCKSPFPSMPVGFWNDPGDAKYRAAYFERFPGVWHHGDWIATTGHGGYVIYGRSDATLKPGGVRIGTAEIYRQVEQLEDVVESLAVGQEWQGDERIVLFVRLASGRTLDAALQKRIADHIRRNASPKHVPARIVQVTDIPRTKSGKIVELAVRSVIHGREIKNLEALANPEALEQFRGRSELET